MQDVGREDRYRAFAPRAGAGPLTAAVEPHKSADFSWKLHRRRADLQTITRALAWLVLLAIVAATLSPAGGRPHLFSHVTAERVGAHFLLGFLFCVGYRRRWQVVLVFVLTATAGLEVAQLLVVGRHAEVADALFKMSGSAAGFVAGSLFRITLMCDDPLRESWEKPEVGREETPIRHIVSQSRGSVI